MEAFAKQQEIPGQQEDQSETTDSNQSVKEETITSREVVHNNLTREAQMEKERIRKENIQQNPEDIQEREIGSQLRLKKIVPVLIEFSKVFVELRDRINEEETTIISQKAHRLFVLLSPYESYIRMYRKYIRDCEEYMRKHKADAEKHEADVWKYKPKDSEKAARLDELCRVFLTLVDYENGHANLRDLDGAGILRSGNHTASYLVQAKVKELKGGQAEKPQEERQRENKVLDAKLTEMQKEAVGSIDRWIMQRATRGDVNPAFLDKVISLSMREKLYMYSLISNGLEKGLNGYQELYAMTAQVPSEKQFAKNMKYSKRHVLRTIMNNNIHWEKLEVAYRIVTGQRDLLMNVVQQLEAYNATILEDYVQPDETDEADNETIPEYYVQQVSEKFVESEAGATQENEAQNWRKAIADITESNAGKVLNRANLELVKAIEDCDKAWKSYDAQYKIVGWLNNSKKKKFEQELQKVNERREYQTQAMKDFAVSAATKLRGYGFQLDENQFGLYYDTKKERLEGKEESKGKKGATIEESFIRQGLSMGVQSGKVADAFGIQSYDATRGLTFAGGIFSIMNGIFGLYTAVVEGQYEDLVQRMRAAGYAERFGLMAGGAKPVLNSVWGITSGSTFMAYASQMAMAKQQGDAVKAAAGSIANVSQGLKITGAVVSTTAFALQAADTVVQVKQYRHMKSAQEKLYDLQKKEGEDADAVISGKDAEYTNNILRLTERKKDTSLMNSSISLGVSGISAGVALAALFVPGAGVAISSIMAASVGVGVWLATTIATYLRQKNNHKKSCAEFLKLRELESLDLPEYIKNSLKRNNLANEEFLKHVMDEIAAELGYRNIDSFYSYIVQTYAKLVYNRMFFEKGNLDKPIYREENGPSDKPEDKYKQEDKEGNAYKESHAWVEYCKSLGLRVRFPKNAADTRGRKPSIKVIAQKMA